MIADSPLSVFSYISYDIYIYNPVFPRILIRLNTFMLNSRIMSNIVYIFQVFRNNTE